MTYSFIWEQDNRCGVVSLNIHLGCSDLLATETGYSRGYYLGSEKCKDLFGETVFLTYFFI